MSGAEWLLESVLVLLLSFTLFHAVRLERALGVLRRDRGALEALVVGFHESTRLAEDGAERLRLAAEIAGKQITRQVERANGLKDDLVFLTERGEKLADALEGRVAEVRIAQSGRVARLEPTSGETISPPVDRSAPVRSKAERDLIRALKLGRT